MGIEQLAGILTSCTALLGLYWLGFVFLPQLKVARFRTDLEAIRHEMYMKAQRGQLKESDSAYQTLDSLMRALCEEAPHITVAELTTVAALSRGLDPSSDTSMTQSIRSVANVQRREIYEELDQRILKSVVMLAFGRSPIVRFVVRLGASVGDAVRGVRRARDVARVAVFHWGILFESLALKNSRVSDIARLARR